MSIVKRSTVSCLSAFIMIVMVPAVAPATADVLTPTEYLARQKSFIKQLYSGKDYFNCIAETRRLIVHFPQIREKNDYLFFLEMSYYLWGQYKTVITRYNSTTGPSFRHSLLAAAGYGALHRHNQALEILYSLEQASLPPDKRRDLLLRTADHLLGTAGYADALQKVNAYLIDNPGDTAVTALGRELERFRELPLKSTAVAVSLSALFPGTGQVYAGRPRDGIISLAALGVLAAGSILSYQRGDRVIGTSLGITAVLVYGGTLYGAYNAAAAHNRSIHRDYQDDLRRNHIPPYRPETYLNPEIFQK